MEGQLNQNKDINQMENEEQEQLQIMRLKQFLIDPFNGKYQIYIIYINSLGIIILILLPFRVFFALQSVSESWNQFDLFLTFNYIIKIIIELNCPIIYDDGKIEYRHKPIFIRYFTQQFLIDLIICIPVNQNQIDNFFYIQNSLRFFIIFDIIKKFDSQSMNVLQNKINNFIKFVQIPTIIFQFINKIIVIFIIAHCFACFWFGISTYYHEDNLFYEKLKLLSTGQQYLQCFYYSIVVLFTIGYGDITATFTFSRIFFFLLTLINIIIYGYIMADFTSIFYEFLIECRTNEVKKEEFFFQIQDKYEISDKYLIQLMSSEQKKINSKIVTIDIFKMDRILQLSPNLQEEISMATCKTFIDTINFFQGKPQFFMSQIFSKCTMNCFQKGDQLFNKNANSNFVYFIYTGRIYQNRTVSKFSVNISYVQGSYYGYEDYFDKQKRQGTCYVQCDQTTLLILENEQFEECLKNCSFAEEEVHQQVKIRQAYLYKIENEIKQNNQLFQESSLINDHQKNLEFIHNVKNSNSFENTNFLKLQLLGSLQQLNDNSKDDQMSSKYRKSLRLKFDYFQNNQIYFIEQHNQLEKIMKQLKELDQQIQKDEQENNQFYINTIKKLTIQNDKLDQEINRIRQIK